MSPLSTKVEFCRLYPKKLNYLFLAVFAFFSPFCYAKTAFSYSPDILSPCTPDVTMVKNVVKSVSEKMICGHRFESWKCFQITFADREKTHRKQRRNIPITACGLPDWKQRKLCGQYRSTHMVKLCGRSREPHHSFLRRCCIVTLLQAVVKAPLKIKIRTQNLIRSKQRKASSRSSPSSRR